ncbi:hypothetical protein B0H13DRAFT_1851494 [Mycena leptocephala]|nr:hypothetical protein B0H13DRAFT_1851494 [Mycena leptocephala]
MSTFGGIFMLILDIDSLRSLVFSREVDDPSNAVKVIAIYDLSQDWEIQRRGGPVIATTGGWRQVRLEERPIRLGTKKLVSFFGGDARVFGWNGWRQDATSGIERWETILYGTGTVRVRPYTGGKAADGIPWINSLIIDPRSNIRHTQQASAHEESITECSEMFNFHDGYGRKYAVTGGTGGTRAVRASAPWSYGRLNRTVRQLRRNSYGRGRNTGGCKPYPRLVGDSIVDDRCTRLTSLFACSDLLKTEAPLDRLANGSASMNPDQHQNNFIVARDSADSAIANEGKVIPATIFPFLKWYTVTELQVVIVFQWSPFLGFILCQYSTSVAWSGKVALVFYGIEDPTLPDGTKALTIWFSFADPCKTRRKQFLNSFKRVKTVLNGNFWSRCIKVIIKAGSAAGWSQDAGRLSSPRWPIVHQTQKCLQNLVHRFTSIAKLSEETLGLESTPKAVVSGEFFAAV